MHFIHTATLSNPKDQANLPPEDSEFGEVDSVFDEDSKVDRLLQRWLPEREIRGISKEFAGMQAY